MRFVVVLVVIGVSLLVCSPPIHTSANGLYQPSLSQQSTPPQQQEKPETKDIKNALVNMDPETFKSIILSIPDLKNFLLQFDAHQLMVAFKDAISVTYLNPEQFKEAIRNQDNFNHVLSGIGESNFKTILLHFCLNNLQSFISYLDKATIESIMCATRQQPDGPMHPQNSDGQPSPSPHCPSNPQESYQHLPRHPPSPTHSNLSHFDKTTNQEISSTLPQSRHEKDSTIHISSAYRSSSSILLIVCTSSSLFYILSL
ncbi:hypothetical protein Aperf_G00000065584 [Anoplocephala perfoliata]